MTVKVLQIRDQAQREYDIELTPVSKDPEWSELSPFFLGPCRTPDGTLFHNMENLWQFSKVYPEHLDKYREINADWWTWHKQGAEQESAQRYPMGKSRAAQTQFSRWGSLRLSYVAARKLIYVPEYAKLLEAHPKFRRLRREYKKGASILIRDYDAHDIDKVYAGSNKNPWLEALNNPKRKFGHGFVMGMALMFWDKPRWYEQWVI